MGCIEECVKQVHDLGGKLCASSKCEKLKEPIDKACHQRAWPEGHPYVIENPDGSTCYCCCGCVVPDIHVATGAESYRPIEDLKPGDEVLALEQGQEWRPATVCYSSGMEIVAEAGSTLLRRISYRNPAGEAEQIVVTQDHLFLTPSGSLIQAKELLAGSKLARFDGTEATVASAQIYTGSYSLRYIATGEYVGGDLSGHLINANGLVMADFALQMSYATGQVSESFLP